MLRIDVWDWTKGKTLTFQFPAVSRYGPDSKRQRTPLEVRDFHITAVWRERSVHGASTP